MMEIQQKTILVINVHEDDVLCFRKEVILALANEGYKMVLLYPLGDRYTEIESDRIKCVNVKMDRHGINPFKDIKLFFSYIKAMKMYKPDVCLLYTIKPNIYGSIAARLRRIPFINNITGIGGSLHGKDSTLQKFIKFLYKIALKKSSHVYFQNRDNCEYFAKNRLCNMERTSIIPGSGVDLKRFSYIPQKHFEDAPIFNFIGRVMEKKGIYEYLATAEQVKAKYPLSEFNVIGFFEKDESNLKNIIEKAEENGIIKYRGSQKNIKPWIERSNAIILPSKYGEGISNVLLESAAVGRALITSDIPGCRDLVTNNNGYICKAGNASELTKCVLKFIQLSNEEQDAMGYRSRIIVEEHFSREIVVNSYVNLLRELFKQVSL